MFLAENIDFKMWCKKREGVHEINRDRPVFGEYHHLFPQLKGDKSRFRSYIRMQIETFNYILENIEESLTKNWGNWHQRPILPEERLVICLR